MTSEEPKPKDVAEWMMERLKEVKFLQQRMAVYEIKAEFGDDFVYRNRNHNLAIDRDVLAEFRKISGDDVVWERGSRRWCFRKEYHKPGREQDR